jgi:exopolysaccharide biosynthesis polyprenyl glycosylphosphotransferase
VATLAPVADVAAVGPAHGAGHDRAGLTAAGDHDRPRHRSRALRVVATTALADLVSVPLIAAVSARAEVAMPPGVVVGMTALWGVLLFTARGYQDLPRRHDRRTLRAVLRAGVFLGLCCWALSTFFDVAPSEQLMALTLAVTSLALLHRLAVAAWSARADVAGGGTTVLVAGDPDAVARAAAELRRTPAGSWRVVSACVTERPDHVDLDDLPVSVGVERIAEAAASAGAEAVLLLPCRELDPHGIRRLGWQLEAHRTRLLVGTGLLDVVPSRTVVDSVGDLSVVELGDPSWAPARMAKTVLERVGATLLLLALAPVLAAVAVAVRLDTPGPAIFRQVRVGRHGREFVMYKFRTMTLDAEKAVVDLADRNESEGALLFKIRQDPRITRVGAFLRRYSVDELPQLLNVVTGDMALVGPRPALPGEVMRYEHDPRRRLAVRPGLTGLWQVSGRSDLSWEDTVRLDLHYVDNWSFSLDVRIVCRTLRAVLRHDGAY